MLREKLSPARTISEEQPPVAPYVYEELPAKWKTLAGVEKIPCFGHLLEHLYELQDGTYSFQDGEQRIEATSRGKEITVSFYGHWSDTSTNPGYNEMLMAQAKILLGGYVLWKKRGFVTEEFKDIVAKTYDAFSSASQQL